MVLTLLGDGGVGRPFLTGNIGHYEIERGGKEGTERKEERGKQEMASCTVNIGY